MNSLSKAKLEKNSLRKRKCKLYFLADFRLACPSCASAKIQELMLIAKDKHGDFSVASYRCVECDYHWPREGHEKSFNRFLDGDI